MRARVPFQPSLLFRMRDPPRKEPRKGAGEAKTAAPSSDRLSYFTQVHILPKDKALS